jgi:hypothetical protein
MSGMKEGWGGLDAERQVDPAKAEREAQDRVDLDLAYAKTFGTKQGRAVLAELRRITVEAGGLHPTLVAAGVPFHEQLIYREGQRDLVRDIERRMRRAAGG